ncbi:hypothetical protein Q8A64_02505 [Oxalobacteraceae bacterium R-40]|uniref:Uncharacterized protein n=1 Tax=Keguizhuia sedimenti TaxID=3064264 RepID=A0ABU1BJU7_9BURK|nr:hypothetical protein [Oxalobacteraceae bacterium R-40]
MKKSLITTLIAVPALSLSALSFAAEPVALTSAQMDGVTAGTNSGSNYSFIWAGQFNASPVTVVQANILTIGSGNESAVQSGNFISVRQGGIRRIPL